MNLDCSVEAVNGLKLCGLNVLRKGDQLHTARMKGVDDPFHDDPLNNPATDMATGSEN